MLRPQSILGLVLIGFTLALLPLAAALAVATMYVNRLAGQSQAAVVQAAEASQGGRLLINQLIAMERSVRQYLVLGDPTLLEVYRKHYAGWRLTVERLAALDLAVEQRAILSRLDDHGRALFVVLGSTPAAPHSIAPHVGEFDQMIDLGRIFLGQSANWVDREVTSLKTLARDATSIVGWTLITVVPVVLVLAGGFAMLIVRPLQEIAQAIHRLGNEDFATPITVRGPRDMEALGRRLDWLRGRLAELEEQKARFLRHMSHELKTPLTTLREGVELLADRVVGPLSQRQQEVTTILRDNVLRLQRLIEGLLDFNLALSRELTLHRTPVDLTELVRCAAEAQKLAWQARGLRLRTCLESVCLEADWDKLMTLVDNLLSNAIKFSPPGGEIQVELKVLDGVARLEVRDQGPGFRPEDGRRVFEPFYQGRTVAAGPVKGSGLGLAIALEYARLHRGTLEIIAVSGGGVRLNLPIV